MAASAPAGPGAGKAPPKWAAVHRTSRSPATWTKVVEVDAIKGQRGADPFGQAAFSLGKEATTQAPPSRILRPPTLILSISRSNVGQAHGVNEPSDQS